MSIGAVGDTELDELQRDTFRYFVEETDPHTGLVPDSTRDGAPSSIAAVGFALAAYTVGSERRFIERSEAIKRVLATLRFFRDSPQGEARDATGYQGFYHFLECRRADGSSWSRCRRSTRPSARRRLAAAAYFDGEAKDDARSRAWPTTLSSS